MKKLYLVDVSSMFFRAFFAIPPLRTSAGLPTNALYGLLAMSIKLLRETKPDYMVFCYDQKDGSFRSELYEDYKANRDEMPEDLVPQMPYIKWLVEKLGIPSCELHRYEADDVIGTLAKQGVKNNLDVTIVSGDKDFAQLVGDRITLFDTMKNIRYDRQGVVEKWGVEPEQIIDYLAIVGDTSDNIPGVKGVGPKGAQKLLSEFKTLDGIYKNIDKIKSESVRSKLIESKDSAYLAQKLVTIVTDAPISFSTEDMQLKSIDREDLKKLLDELEFSGFMKKIFSNEADNKNSSEPSVKRQSTSEPNQKSSVEIRASSSAKSKSFSTDKLARVQWTLQELKERIEPYDDIWAVRNERGFCLGYNGQAIQVDGTLAEIGAVLDKKKLGWKGFDIKSVWHSLSIKEHSTPRWDSMLAAYVVKAGVIDDFSKIYKQHVGAELPDLADPEDVLACELELEKALLPKLEETRGMKVLETLELPLVPVLYQMEKVGILIDKEDLKAQSQSLSTDIAKLEAEIHKLAGESFNISSPKQLGAILFEKLKIPMVKKTKTGYSTDNDVLSKLQSKYPICSQIINYRELTKLKSTYVDSLPQLVSDHDQRIHTHFHQALTQTGRLSSTNPNLQNIPIRTERGRAIRRAFVAKPDHCLLSIDYSQIELRVLAQITGDPGLTEAFKKNLDIHAATAAEIFSVSVNDVNPEQRRMAKAVNFGIAYGQGVYGLAETLEISREESKEIIENYFKKFKKVKDYMMDVVSLAKEQGYVETLFGRRRYMDEFNSASSMVRKFGERAAINAPMQGTASDLMKMAMINVFESSSIPMLMQVHDELLFECPKEDVEREAQSIKNTMESVTKFDVPLVVNVAWGDNWEDAHA